MEYDKKNIKNNEYKPLHINRSSISKTDKKTFLDLSLEIFHKIMENNLINPNHSIYSSSFLPQTMFGDENFIKESIEDVIDIKDKLSGLMTYLINSVLSVKKDEVLNKVLNNNLYKNNSQRERKNDEKNKSNNKNTKKIIPLKKIEIKPSKVSPNPKPKNPLLKNCSNIIYPRSNSPPLKPQLSKKLLNSPQQIIHVPSYIRNGLDFKKSNILKQFTCQLSLKTAETSKNLNENSMSKNSNKVNEYNKASKCSNKCEYHHFHELSFGIKSEQTNPCSPRVQSPTKEPDSLYSSYYRCMSPIEMVKQEGKNDFIEEYVFVGKQCLKKGYNQKNKEKLESLYKKVNK
jgi:hypothetical protein